MRRFAVVLIALSVFLILAGGTADAIDIDPGSYFYEILPGSFVDLGPDFGDILVPLEANGDTIVEVLPPGGATSGPDTQVFIDIEMVALSLVSVDPIELGSPGSFFDVFVELVGVPWTSTAVYFENALDGSILADTLFINVTYCYNTFFASRLNSGT